MHARHHLRHGGRRRTGNHGNLPGQFIDHGPQKNLPLIGRQIITSLAKPGNTTPAAPDVTANRATRRKATASMAPSRSNGVQRTARLPRSSALPILVHYMDLYPYIWTLLRGLCTVKTSGIARHREAEGPAMSHGTGHRLVVDWGSSNFRAYRFTPDGEIIDRHQANAGILTVTQGGFEDVLMREIGHWITPQSQVLFSGMITSRNGWVETPYVETPAQLGDLARDAVTRTAGTGAYLPLSAGVCARTPVPDVMRGEEIQVFGAIEPNETATLVLPAHTAKWVTVTDGRITGFRTS